MIALIFEASKIGEFQKGWPYFIKYLSLCSLIEFYAKQTNKNILEFTTFSWWC